MSIRVLLVEDSPAMRTFVGTALEMTGEYVVEEVKDGLDALRLVPRSDFDLVITDINMPDINGLELIHAIRQHPRHLRTPIVVITTADRQRDVDRALKLGARTVLVKPFTREDLLATVARVWEESRTVGDRGGGGDD